MKLFNLNSDEWDGTRDREGWRVKGALVGQRIGGELIGATVSEVERLIGLGATEVHWDKRPPDADYVILADPEGNRFCVVDTAR